MRSDQRDLRDDNHMRLAWACRLWVLPVFSDSVFTNLGDGDWIEQEVDHETCVSSVRRVGLFC